MRNGCVGFRLVPERRIIHRRLYLSIRPTLSGTSKIASSSERQRRGALRFSIEQRLARTSQIALVFIVATWNAKREWRYTSPNFNIFRNFTQDRTVTSEIQGLRRSIDPQGLTSCRTKCIDRNVHAPVVQLECENSTAEYAARRKVYLIYHAPLLITRWCSVIWIFSCLLWNQSRARANNEKLRYVCACVREYAYWKARARDA